MGDPDSDGDMEMISACQDSFVYVWECPDTTESYTLEWPMFQQNGRHPGFYHRSQTSVADERHILPEVLSVFQNYPEPFNSGTAISYNLSVDSHIELTISNIKVKKVNTFGNGLKGTGSHNVVWKGTSQQDDIRVFRDLFCKDC